MSNNTTSTSSVLDDKIALISINIGMFAGYRRATRENIAALGGSLPISNAVTQGSIKIFPSEALKPFSTIRRSLFRTIEAKGIRALGSRNVFAVPKASLDGLEKEIAKAHDLFAHERDKLDTNYDQVFEQHVTANSEAEVIIRGLKIERPTAMAKLHFGSNVFRIIPYLREGENAEQGVASIVQGLARQLYEEISAEIADLAKNDAFLKNARAGQKTLRPIKAAVTKMKGLSFLDASIDGAVQFIEGILLTLPKVGYIENNEIVRPFTTLSKLVDVLADTDSLVNAAGKVSNGIPAMEVLFPTVSVPSSALPVEVAVSVADTDTISEAPVEEHQVVAENRQPEVISPVVAPVITKVPQPPAKQMPMPTLPMAATVTKSLPKRQSAPMF